MSDGEHPDGQRFLSVVDIAEDDVRRRIQDKNQTVNDSKYRENEDTRFDEGLRFV